MCAGEDIANRGAVTIRQGKGCKARMVYLSRNGAGAVAAWRRVSAVGDGPVFRAISKAKHVLERRARL